MIYLFKGGSEYFEVDLKDDTILLKGNLTNQKWLLFRPQIFRPDRNKMHTARLILSKWPRLKKAERELYLRLEFYKMGYFFIKKYEL